jgi:hypothetical protein
MSKLERGIMEYLTLHYGESPTVGTGKYGPMMYNPNTFEAVYRTGYYLNGEFFCMAFDEGVYSVYTFSSDLMATLCSLFNISERYVKEVTTDWVRIHCPDCLIPNKGRITSPHPL